MRKKRNLPPDLLRLCIAAMEGESIRAAPPDTLEAFLDPWRPGTTPLEAKMQPSDELWIWSTADSTCESLTGRGGYAVVRGGKVIDYLNVWMS